RQRSGVHSDAVRHDRGRAVRPMNHHGGLSNNSMQLTALRAAADAGTLDRPQRETCMFGKRQNRNALEPPPIAKAHADAVEVLRVWALPGNPQELTLRTTWKDAG